MQNKIIIFCFRFRTKVTSALAKVTKKFAFYTLTPNFLTVFAEKKGYFAECICKTAASLLFLQCVLANKANIIKRQYETLYY